MLTNVEILSALVSKGHISNFDPNRLEPASYDMVIGTIFQNGEIINAGHSKANDPIIIAPGEVVTMLTLEELHLPDDIAATAYAMNAQSSEGLLVLNPGHVDPGYKGPLTVVTLNLRKVPLALQLEDKIFTVVFEQLNQPSVPAYKVSNTTRGEFERKANKKVVEKSIGSLKELLAMTEKDIRTIVGRHWATWAANIIAIATLAVALAALVFAVVAVLPKDNVKSDSIAQTNSGVSTERKTTPVEGGGAAPTKNRPAAATKGQ